jgi:hypothetical protein
MILVRLMGGLGNQMFQYAFGRALSLKYETELVLDPTLLGDRSMPNEVATHRAFDLDIFNNLKYRLAKEKEVFLFNGNTQASAVQKASRKINTFFSPKKLVIQRNNELDIESSDDTCYVGRWQSYKFFEGEDEIIKKDFQLPRPTIAGIEELADQIKNCNSICVHVRRTDLISSELYSKTIGALDLNYYKRAMDIIYQMEKEPIYFVFSDDMTWCKQNIKADGKIQFVENAMAGDKAEGHLYLMTQCKHFIISNSTFSWWGAFLAENKTKKVIYPSQWFKDEALKNPYMSPKEWTGI